jgi:hypothetical protein
VTFNYLGNLDAGRSKGPSNRSLPWSLTDEESGSSVGPSSEPTHLLSVLAYALGPKLILKFGSRVGEEVVGAYERHLGTILTHIRCLGRKVLTPSDLGPGVSGERLERLQREEEVDWIGPANSLQTGFISHHLAQVGSTSPDDAYHVQSIFRYEGNLRVHGLKGAWETALSLFPALRLRFDWTDSPLQIISSRLVLDWTYVEGDEGLVYKVQVGWTGEKGTSGVFSSLFLQKRAKKYGSGSTRFRQF